MRQTQTPLGLMLFVDALRPDYLVHAPFLRSLAAESATGAFRECFGFVQHQAYYGGLKPDEYGFTNFYCFDPAQSPFRLARALTLAGGATATAEREGARALVDRTAREQMTPYARTHASSLQVPLSYAPNFDVAEKRAPWDSRIGYRSCFAIFDEIKLPWRQRLWPDTNRLSDRTDGGIVRQILTDLGPEDRMAFVHLQELDALGHVFGPNSPELQKGVAKTDEHCRHLIESLRARYSEVKVVIFGDHGMVNVTRTLDLRPQLEAAGLTFGVDYAYFLDSTMARFWFLHRAARQKLEQALASVPGGHLLGDDELERYGIARCDRRNGESYFLADPGVLLFPNFFQSGGEPVRGMHGYDLDCPDNYGYFLLHDPSRTEWSGGSLGVVDSTSLFPVLLEMAGLDSETHTKLRVPARLPATKATGRFTAEEGGDAVIRGHLDRIVQAVAQRVGQVEAVVLTGSFGRGEGGVFRDEDDNLRPVNDYDIMIVDRRDLSGPLAGLDDVLASELGIDFVDLSTSDGRWEQWPLTIANYDLKYGSQVIAGNPAVLDRLPTYASADLPPEEIVRLLLNRTAGLLIGLRGKILGGEAPTEDERRFLANQVVKALMALGDWHLFLWRGYDSSYARRRERFAALASGAGVGPVIAAKICQAYDFKCRPDYAQFSDGVGEIRLLYAELEAAWIQSIQRLAGKPAKTLTEAMAHYRARMGPASPRHATYATLPLVLQAAVAGGFGEAFQHARPQLPFRCDLPLAAKFTPENWELVRAAAVQSWFTECH
jgi:Type I phosphodiesterase / nucleotide pyrophosphatase